jgi:hypothetical protein
LSEIRPSLFLVDGGELHLVDCKEVWVLDNLRSLNEKKIKRSRAEKYRTEFL